MKLSSARIMLPVLLVVLGFTSGCGLVNGIRAKIELNDGATSYRAGDYDKAQQHFERSLELDPDQKNAQLFRARAIERQYRPGNDQKAREAITAYQDILKNDPYNEEAYNGVARMYRGLKEDDKLREWVKGRANDTNAPADRRSLAFTFLASEQRKCSNDITELPDNKQTVNKDGKMVIEYKKPKDPADFERAQRCIAEGLRLAEQAVSLNGNSEAAWAVKANLLLEAARLAQMDNNQEQRANYERQFEQAKQRNAQLAEETRRRKEAEATPTPAT